MLRIRTGGKLFGVDVAKTDSDMSKIVGVKDDKIYFSVKVKPNTKEMDRLIKKATNILKSISNKKRLDKRKVFHNSRNRFKVK